MALTFGTLSGSYLWPVTVPVPVDGGEIETLEFKGRFKRFTQQESEAILKRAIRAQSTLMSGSEPKDSDTDLGIAPEVMIGWEDMPGDAGTVPFTAEGLEQLLSYGGAARAITQAWNESLSGKKAKN
jgi:hypothetical protein